MDYPHHHNRHGRREEEEPYPPPGQPHPPPYYGVNEPPPPFPPPPQPFAPPPQVHHTSHIGPGPPPPTNYAPPPPAFVGGGPHPHHEPHPPSFAPHPAPHHELANRPSVRIYCRGETNHSLAIRDGKVIVARSNPSDPFQHWIKEEKFGTRVKDEEGFPSFSLINKATGQALKHSVGAEKPVQLIPYNPNALDESILWTESKDTGDNYRTIRMVNNIKLNVDVFHGDKKHGGVHDGSTVYLWEWKKGDNQRWKIVPY